MGSALATAVAAKVGGDKVLVCDKDLAKAQSVAEKLGAVAGDISTVAAECKYIFLGVKPQMMAGMLAEIADVLKSRQDKFVLVTMAAGLTLDTIAEMAGIGAPVIRIMPNTPAQVGLGVAAVCPVGLSDEESEVVLRLLGTCGETILCDENTLDAIGCVSGTGPAYVMLFIEAMADAAVSLGIKRADALKIAAATVAGSGKLALETGTHPAVLKDMVCSPGGTTIAGVMALEENGLRNAVIKSVTAAYDKTQEMKGNK